MIHLSKREKLLFISTIVIILGSFIYRGIIESTVKSWKYLNQQVSLKEAKLARNLKIIAQETIVRQEFSQYQDFVFPAVSDEEQIAKLLKEVEKIARSCGVRITDMAPRGKERINFYDRFAIDLEAEAAMTDLVKFIFALENSQFLFEAEKIKISLKSSQSNILKCDLLLAKVFF